jgi:hypothetical protein
LRKNVLICNYELAGAVRKQTERTVNEHVRTVQGYTIAANMAPMYSARFWLDESTRNARLTAQTPLTTSEPSVLGIQENSEVAVIRHSRLNTVCGGYGARYIELRRYSTPLQFVNSKFFNVQYYGKRLEGIRIFRAFIFYSLAMRTLR